MRNKIQQETKFEYTDEVITWHNYLNMHVLAKTFPSTKPAQWSLWKGMEAAEINAFFAKNIFSNRASSLIILEVAQNQNQN